VTQWGQVLIQNRLVGPVLKQRGPLSPPWPLRLLQWIPALRRLPARVIGLGVRPEHVHVAEQARQPSPQAA
jgi:hypothetical protein